MKEKVTHLVNLVPVVCVICFAIPAVLILLDGLGIPSGGYILAAASCLAVFFGYVLQHTMAKILRLEVERYGFVGRNKGRIEKFRLAFAPIPIFILAVLSVGLYFAFQDLFIYFEQVDVIDRLEDEVIYPILAAFLFFICGFFGVASWFYPIERLSNHSFIHISIVIFIVEIAGAATSLSRNKIMGVLGACFFVFVVCLMLIFNQTNLQRTYHGTVVADVSPKVRRYNLFLVLVLLVCVAAVFGVTYVIVRGLYIIGSLLVFLVLYKIFYWEEVQRYQQEYYYPSPEETATDFTKVLLENGGNTILPLFIMLATVIVLLIVGAKTGILQKMVAYLKQVIRDFLFTMKLGKELLSETDLYDIPVNGNYKDERKKLQDAMIREYMDLAASTDKYNLFLRRLAKLPDSNAQLSFAYAMLVTVLRGESTALRLSDTPREIQRKVVHLVPEEDIALITRDFEFIKYGGMELTEEEASGILERMCTIIKRYIF